MRLWLFKLLLHNVSSGGSPLGIYSRERESCSFGGSRIDKLVRRLTGSENHGGILLIECCQLPLDAPYLYVLQGFELAMQLL